MSSSVAAPAASSAAAPAPSSASASASASASVAPAPSSVAASSSASSAAASAASSAASSSAAASVAPSSSASAASSSAAASSSSASVASSSASASSSIASSSIASSSSSSSRKPTSSNTTTNDSQSNMTSPNSPSSLSTGAIIGIVVGVVGGLVLIALFWRWCKRRKDNKLPKAPLPPPRDPTSMRQRAPGGGGGSVSGMNRASSYSTLLGPTAYAQSHSRQPSLSDSLPLHSGISSHHLQQKSSMSSLNKVDEHMPSPDGLEAGQGTRPSPLPTPSDSSHGSRTNSPYPPSDFMPSYPRQGPASSLNRPEWQRSSISSLSSSVAGGSYGVTHTGKLVSVQMPKRLGAPRPDENGDFFTGNRGRVPSGIARWRDDLQAPSLNHHTRTPSTLSFNSPAVSSSEGSDSAEHVLRK